MTPVIVLAVVFGVLGLAIGSFLNVVIHRVPRGESVVSPPSHCPRCDAQILNRHNVPVLGWLMLHGRCHHCALPISARYPLVEAVTGLLFALVTVAVGVGLLLPLALIAVAAVLTLAMIAFDHLHAQQSTVAQPSIAPSPAPTA